MSFKLIALINSFLNIMFKFKYGLESNQGRSLNEYLLFNVHTVNTCVLPYHLITFMFQLVFGYQ